MLRQLVGEELLIDGIARRTRFDEQPIMRLHVPERERQVRRRQHFLPFRSMRRRLRAAEWVTVALGIYVLITAVTLIGSGFKLAAGQSAGELFQFASNPFVGLMIARLIVNDC